MYGDIAGKIRDIIQYQKEICELMKELNEVGVEFCACSCYDFYDAPRMHVSKGIGKIARDMGKKVVFDEEWEKEVGQIQYIIEGEDATIFSLGEDVGFDDEE